MHDLPPGSVFHWERKGGGPCKEAVYAVTDATGTVRSEVSFPGLKNSTQKLRRRSWVVTGNRRYVVVGFGGVDSMLHSTSTDARNVGEYTFRNRKSARKSLTLSGDIILSVHFSAWGSYKTPGAEMTLTDKIGRTSLSLQWAKGPVNPFDMPATHARRFRHGLATLGDGDVGRQTDLLMAYAFHMFMRPYLQGGGG